MTDLELMQSIKTNQGGAIAAAAGQCTIPAAFFAALIANESGGDPDAKRFEPTVLASLWQVLLGRKAAYGSLTTKALIQFVADVAAIPPLAPQSLPADAFQRLDALATSWGLTQIMGYNALGFSLSIPDLADPTKGLFLSTKMLTSFAYTYHLDVTQDFEQLFRCWNGGHPTAPTFDPNYVANGLARMALWSSLP